MSSHSEGTRHKQMVVGHIHKHRSAVPAALPVDLANVLADLHGVSADTLKETISGLSYQSQVRLAALGILSKPPAAEKTAIGGVTPRGYKVIQACARQKAALTRKAS